jgi:hypothetical protein
MTTLREAVQEFVADYDCGGCGHFAAYAENFRKLLAQPDPDKKPLTDEEITSIAAAVYGFPSKDATFRTKFVRTVERAHNIGEKQ